MKCAYRKMSWLLLPAILLPFSVVAHHSTPHDPTQITVEGVLTEVSWKNPHIQFHVLETTENGATREWILDQPSATSMHDAGVGEELFLVGSPVRIYGPTIRNRADRMTAWNMLFLDTDLEVILVAAQTEPLWSERTIGASIQDLFSVSGPLPDVRQSLFRVWTWNAVPGFWMTRDPDSFPLNSTARDIANDWDSEDPLDNSVLQCIPPGMPATMGDPHPIEFVDLGDVIEIHMEEFDQIRRIHLGDTPDSENIETSRLGYSVGRWEDNALIVDTSRVDARYLTRTGVPMSQDVQIEERFSLDAPNGQLKYMLMVTDPVYLTEPFVHEQIWNWHEGTALQLYDCQIPE